MHYVPKRVVPTVLHKEITLPLPQPEPEPLAWEMAGDRFLLQVQGMRPHQNWPPSAQEPQVKAHNPPDHIFAMHLLRDALLDPMCRLPPPTTHPAPSTQRTLAYHSDTLTHRALSWTEPTAVIQRDTETLVGPDGEPWLPVDPFIDPQCSVQIRTGTYGRNGVGGCLTTNGCRSNTCGKQSATTSSNGG
jgi:hypothetical protein